MKNIDWQNLMDEELGNKVCGNFSGIRFKLSQQSKSNISNS